MALAALGLLAAPACREATEAWVWPPDTAALVEGQAITMAELNQVLGWGLYGQLSGEAPDSAAVPLMVLERLIDERLLMAEAARFNYSLSAAENEISAAGLDEAFPGLSPAQAEALRLNLIRQLVAHKTTARIMAEERRFSAAEWQAFWRAWPRSKATRYQVRGLFLPSSPAAPKLPKAENFEQLAQTVKLEGSPALLSEPVWLQSDNLDESFRAVLEEAWAGQRPSPPVRREGGWAVYEVLNLDRETAAVAELKAARAAYELQIGEYAFSRWLSERRAAADIKISPNLTQAQEE